MASGTERERDEEIPDGCECCFRNPDVLAGLSNETHRRTATLVNESHLGVHLAECVHCGQKSVQIFEEEVVVLHEIHVSYMTYM